MDTVNKIRNKIDVAQKLVKSKNDEWKKNEVNGVKLVQYPDNTAEIVFAVNDDADVRLSYSSLFEGG